MSEHQAGHEEAQHAEAHHDSHEVNYFLIYVALVVLFLISVAGPEIGNVTGMHWITLVTAFGIAIVKAKLVIDNFMHLKWEKTLMKWMLVTSLVLMALFVAGVSGDVLNHRGRNWENVAAQAAVERGLGGGEVAMAEEEEVEEGFNVEQTFGVVCGSCHGVNGDGTGPAGAALDPPPANFTDPDFWAERDMDRIRAVISDGAAAVFGGSASMVGWSLNYSDEEIAELAEYVATFRPDA